MTEKKPKGAGRPVLPPPPGKKSVIAVRATPDLKQRLTAIANWNDRSLSAEAEIRLEQSQKTYDLLQDVLSLAYGPRLAGLLILVATAMQGAGRHAYMRATWSIGESDNWSNNSFAYRHAVTAAQRILDAFTPKWAESDLISDDRVGEFFSDLTPEELKKYTETIGIVVAQDILLKSSRATRDEETENLEQNRFVMAARQLLGEEMAERITWNWPETPDETASSDEG